jgi:hypothetical protein
VSSASKIVTKMEEGIRRATEAVEKAQTIYACALSDYNKLKAAFEAEYRFLHPDCSIVALNKYLQVELALQRQNLDRKEQALARKEQALARKEQALARKEQALLLEKEKELLILKEREIISTTQGILIYHLKVKTN